MFRDFLDALDKLDSKIKLAALIAVLVTLFMFIIAPKVVDALGGDAASLRRQLQDRNGEIAMLTLDVQRLHADIRCLNEDIRRIERECTARLREYQNETLLEMMELRHLIEQYRLQLNQWTETSEVQVNSSAMRQIPNPPFVEEVVATAHVQRFNDVLLMRIDAKIERLQTDIGQSE